MTPDKTIDTQLRELTIAWVDALFERKWPTLSAEIAEQHLARGRRGFRKGHEYHPPKREREES